MPLLQSLCAYCIQYLWLKRAEMPQTAAQTKKVKTQLTQCGQLDQLNDWAILGDVKEGDFALVLALIRRDDVVHLKLGVRAIVVDEQLTPEITQRSWSV